MLPDLNNVGWLVGLVRGESTYPGWGWTPSERPDSQFEGALRPSTFCGGANIGVSKSAFYQLWLIA